MKDKTVNKCTEIEKNLAAMNNPASKEISNKCKKESKINPSNSTEKKDHKTVVGKMNGEASIKKGADLDVPGS